MHQNWTYVVLTWRGWSVEALLTSSNKCCNFTTLCKCFINHLKTICKLWISAQYKLGSCKLFFVRELTSNAQLWILWDVLYMYIAVYNSAVLLIWLQQMLLSISLQGVCAYFSIILGRVFLSCPMFLYFTFYYAMY